MEQAETKVQKFQAKVLKESKNLEKYLKHQEDVKEHVTHRFDKLKRKMHLARLNQEVSAKQLNHRSDLGYTHGIKEIEQISARKLENDRRHS